MTMRTTSRTVTFSRPFMLSGIVEPQPAGSYTVETDEELIGKRADNRLPTHFHAHPVAGTAWKLGAGAGGRHRRRRACRRPRKGCRSCVINSTCCRADAPCRFGVAVAARAFSLLP